MFPHAYFGYRTCGVNGCKEFAPKAGPGDNIYRCARHFERREQALERTIDIDPRLVERLIR